MKSYKNFEAAISNFAPDMMLSQKDALGAIEISINTGCINKADLLLEVEDAFFNPYFDWIEFAKCNKVIIVDDIQPITKNEAREYIKSLIWDYLHPDSI
ncbi:MAG: hypothetical protein U0U66_14860 [Cytophagaceae bacterium]